MLANTAKQAFLETTIFQIEATFTSPDSTQRISILGVLAAVGARIHHLDVAVPVNMNDFALPENQDDMCMATRTMESLKPYFPNLKTCVLTLDVRFYPANEFHKIFYPGSSSAAPFDEKLLETVCDLDDELKPLHYGIADLFDQFVDVGPGNSQFVRIRFHSIPDPPVQGQEQTAECFSYGPLVKAERVDGEEAPIGGHLIDAAYKLERTGPGSLSQMPFR